MRACRHNAGMTTPGFTLRPLDPARESELDFVAEGMHKTLLEVEGRELYPREWLRDRAAFHLDPVRCTGAIFVAVDAAGALVGHGLVRIEADEQSPRFGLFTTTWVEPRARRAGIAHRLLERGEQWMRGHALPEAATWTSATNAKLIGLYARHGYAQVRSGPNDLTGTMMVKLARSLQAPA